MQIRKPCHYSYIIYTFSQKGHCACELSVKWLRVKNIKCHYESEMEKRFRLLFHGKIYGTLLNQFRRFQKINISFFGFCIEELYEKIRNSFELCWEIKQYSKWWNGGFHHNKNKPWQPYISSFLFEQLSDLGLFTSFAETSFLAFRWHYFVLRHYL